jgi:single-strand DNA-binding protein
VRNNKESEKLMSNAITLSGNLTRDPEIRYTKDGQANASFGLAVNRRWQARGSDTWEEATSFFDVVCWRELAENVALSLVKGSRVIVSGRLEQHNWMNENNERRSSVEVTADEVGPSLRFATAEVSRTERRVPDQMDSPSGSDDLADAGVATADA